MNKASLICSRSERASDLQQGGVAPLGIDAGGLQSGMPHKILYVTNVDGTSPHRGISVH